MTRARTRIDPRAEATREALIEEAETLFAQHGIDGVSLRQIGAAIGSSNTNVVAYHFGGKDELVQAIFRHRLLAIDEERAALLAEAEACGRGHDLAMLLSAMWRPLLEQTNRQGRHSYAAFLDSVFRSNSQSLRTALAPELKATNTIVQRIAAACETEFDERFAARLQICVAMVAAATQLIDQSGHQGERAEARFADMLTMMEAALRAPENKSKGRNTE
jgi:AcrR family transcriptional regulator